MIFKSMIIRKQLICYFNKNHNFSQQNYPMNQIELFNSNDKPGQKTQKQAQVTDQKDNQRKKSPSRLNAKRPDKLHVQKSDVHSQKWRECKIIGKNIGIRSYSGACAFKNKMYVYGGYQILKGMMSDFYCIDLDDKADRFVWEQIDAEGELPGPRSKHALVAGKQKIYLVGGLMSDVQSSHQIYEFNPLKKTWNKFKTEGQTLPEIDSFGCAYIANQNEQKIIVLCGYDGKTADYLNSVYQINITNKKVKLLFQNTKKEQQNAPYPRSGCTASTDGKNVYIFGGKNGGKRMNDLWEFNLTDFKYRQMDRQGDIPPQRNGHSMEYFQGKLYVFGGIHDITWQLDDLHIYSLAKKKWTTLEQDSPRKVERKKATIENTSKQKQQKKSPKRKNWYETVNTLYNNKSTLGDSPSGQKNKNASFKQQQNQSSPVKMIDEQRKKAFLQKKNEMLKNFEVQKDEAKKYVMLQAQSQAIKNSLDVIGEPDPRSKNSQGKLTQFGKETMSKFLQPLTNDSNLVIGKKPCARDGHSSVILNEQLIIFGGDRHQMSFSDIYKLNFNIATQNQTPM